MIPDGIHQPHDYLGDLNLTADAVVVGSGAGGATVAATLAEAGLSVIVLEEGAYHGTADYSANVPEMLSKLMRDGGSTVLMGRSPVPYLEGRCVGGTTVVNGGMCWRTPDHILDEWTRNGLTELSSDKLAPLFTEVEDVIDARYQDPGSEGGVSSAFKRGADALGWKLSRNKRNQRHCVGTNDCVTGCPSGAKRSTLMTWLPRFFKAGGELYTHCKVEKVLTSMGRAVGVSGTLEDPCNAKRRFTIRAQVVVLSCGATQTPLLLQRNKLGKRCGHVGKHFTIHPNIKMSALFDHPIDSLQGTHQAFQCVEFVDEGILLAPGAIPLAMMTAVFPSFGTKLADRLRDYRYIATGGILVDDHSEGSIRTLPFGIPFLHYNVTDKDQDCFIRGAKRMARLYFAAGAKSVFTPFHHLPEIKSEDDIKRLDQVRPKVRDTEYFTAHLMGTCRMSAHPKTGVVDPDGQMWDVPGLYLADASVMPGTIGVNPQVTIMVLARLIGLKLADRLVKQRAA